MRRQRLVTLLTLSLLCLPAFTPLTPAAPARGSGGDAQNQARADPAVVAKGAPLVAPDGVAVAGSGEVYVTDRAAGSCSGGVFEIARNKIRRLVEGVRLGDPAGIGLTLDESRLLVSAYQPDGVHD